MTDDNQNGGGERPGFVVKFFNGLSRVCLMIAGVMLLAIVAINGWNVFSRYVLFSALSWAEEAMVFLMIASVFIGSVSVTWDRSHIAIDALVQKLSPGPRVAVEWLAVAIAAAVLWPFAWLSWGVVQKLRMFEQTSDALHMPVWIPQIMVPVAMGLIPLVMGLALLRRDRKPPSVLDAVKGYE